MEFWTNLHSESAVAAVDPRAGRQWSYGELWADVEALRDELPKLGRKSLGVLVAQNRYQSLTVYLAALQAGCALILLDASLNPDLLREFLATYQPDWLFAEGWKAVVPGFRECRREVPGLLENESPRNIEVHSDLALLLTTSGSTGSPKLVRLTRANLAANATAIARYLELTPQERPITSLPMSYSYGLSVINSHLAVGASIVFTDDGVLQRNFWEAVSRYQCTSFAGVPYTYQMLLQTGLLKSKGATLHILTQAGGRLEERYIQQMYELSGACGRKFFVMYGQTEATARISYVPFEKLGSKIGSVGIAIPDGMLSVDEVTDELIYRGPNVMMGYAESREDLGKGDELNGVLRTGDLARQDDEGYFYITGRLKRFLKMFGKRFNLDDVEKLLNQRLGVSVACYGRDDLLTVAAKHSNDANAIHSMVCETFDLPRPAVKVIAVTELPRTANGKLDYKRLTEAGVENSVVVTAKVTCRKKQQIQKCGTP